MTRLTLGFVCIVLGALPVRADEKKLEPPTPEQIKEWVKKLEVPTRGMSDQREGPPEGPWPTFNYRWHSTELRRAGDAAVPALLGLLEDKSKPGQARAQAAMILIPRLSSTKTKPDPKIVAAINAALKEKDPALRWGVLSWLSSYGLASNREMWEMVKRNAVREKAKGLPPVEWGAIDFLKRVPPPEERSLTPEVMAALLPQVIAALADEHPEVASSAASTIFSFGIPNGGVPELLAALKRKEPVVRAAAAAALGRVGKDDPAALKAVLEELNHPERYTEPYSYQSVVAAVGGFGPKAKDAVPVLIELIETTFWKEPRRKDSHDAYAAVRVLGAIGPSAKAAVPALLKVVERHTHSEGDRDDFIDALDKIDPEGGKQARAIYKRQQDEFRKMYERINQQLPPPIVPPIPNP